MPKSITIANGMGFWGDRPFVPQRILKNGGCDVLTLEYLAELTMSILAVQKQKDPHAGYVHDFPALIKRSASFIKNMQIITNAGGLNPFACAKAVASSLSPQQQKAIKIGIVFGDDIMPQIKELATKNLLRNMDTNESFRKITPKVLSANVYFGAEGIQKCLASGAQIVITGRVADGSLTLAPCMHHFGWGVTDYNLLASGMVAGHLIECGAQVTGGNYNGRKKTTLQSPAYPLATIYKDGSFVLSKEEASHTDGEVSIGSVSEQLIYEINDPQHYLTPDVDCDFTSVYLKKVDKNKVAVSPALGQKPSNFYKISIAYDDGYKLTNSLMVYGADALAKAKEVYEIISYQIKEEKILLKQILPEYLGAGFSVPLSKKSSYRPTEIFLRISAAADSKEELLKFSRLFAPLVTAGPAGVSGYTGGSPKPQKLLGFWPALLDKKYNLVQSDVRVAKDFL